MIQEKTRFQIGEVAKESGASIDTIRYYEAIGLLEKPIRSDGGFRLYAQEAVEKLRFIRKAQRFGLTLEEIKQVVLQSRNGLEPCCDYVGSLLKGKLEELEVKIKELRDMQKGLKGLMKSWIPLKDAKRTKFVVCPQIERPSKKKKRGRVK